MNNEVLKFKILEKSLISDFQNDKQELLSNYCILDNGIKAKNVSLPYLDVKALRGQNEPVIKSEGIKINKGDFAILVDGENSGEVFQMPCDGYLGSTLKKLTFLKGVNDIYIRYFIDLNKELLKNSKTGAAIPHLNKKLFANLTLHVPSNDIQNEIVNKIKDLFELIDKKEKNDQEKLKLKEVLKEKILDEAIHGKLINNDNKLTKPNITKIECDIPYDIPLNWIWTKIGEVGKVVGGGTPKTNIESYWGGKISWITPADMKSDDKYISNGRKNITETGLSESSAILMPSGTIVISSRAPIGYVKIARNEVSTSQGCKSIIPNDKIVKSDYVFYYIKAIREYLNSIGTGTTFREISGKNLSDVLIPVPPLEEQQRIVEKIEQCFELIEQL